MVIDGLITEEHKGQDLKFYFGILTFKLLSEQLKMPFNEVQETLLTIGKQYKEDPIPAMNLVIDVMYCAHTAATMIAGEKPALNKPELWALLDVWGVEKFMGILTQGLVANQDEGAKKATAQAGNQNH